MPPVTDEQLALMIIVPIIGNSILFGVLALVIHKHFARLDAHFDRLVARFDQLEASLEGFAESLRRPSETR